MRYRRVIFLLFMAVILSSTILFGDTVVLKNNMVIRGKITAESEEEIVVEHAFGKTAVARPDILRIERDSTRLDSFLDRLSETAYMIELSFAPPLSAKSENEIQSILDAFPNHAEARMELGYIREGNEWVKPGTKERVTVPDAPIPAAGPVVETGMSPAKSLFDSAIAHLGKARYRDAGKALRETAGKFPGTAQAREAARRMEGDAALTVRQLEINGPSANRIDLVFIAEGYTNIWENESDLNGDGIISNNEQAKFDEDVRDIMAAMVKEPPFADYRHYFNFHQINVVSRQVGADTPWRNPPRIRDTTFWASHPDEDADRLLVVDNHAVKRFVSKYVPFDVIVVLVNDAWGGSGTRRVATIGINRYETEISYITWNMKYVRAQVLHELGHALASLGDEYEYTGVSLEAVLAEREPPFPNVTREKSRSRIKWRHWIEPETPVPTPGRLDRVGLYEGAFYQKRGYYRPQFECRMRDSFKPFCRVCREAIVRRIYRNVNLIEKATPDKSSVKLPAGASQVFSIKSPARTGRTVGIEWTLDGIPLAGEAPFSRTLDAGSLTKGSHTLRVTLKDRTRYVRSDPEERLTASREWRVDVGGD